MSEADIDTYEPNSFTAAVLASVGVKAHWRTIDVSVAALGFGMKSMKDVFVHRMSEIPLVMATSVTMEVSTVEAAAQMRLWEQGDESLYTLKALEARFRNRTHPEVLKCLQLWWEICRRSAPAEAPSAAAAALSEKAAVEAHLRRGRVDLEEQEAARAQEEARIAADMRRKGRASRLPQFRRRTQDVARSVRLRENAVLPRAAHQLLCVALVRALLEEDEAWDEQEALRLARQAWETDTRGENALSRTLFNDSLFELADMWTVSHEADECVALPRPTSAPLPHASRMHRCRMPHAMRCPQGHFEWPLPYRTLCSAPRLSPALCARAARECASQVR